MLAISQVSAFTQLNIYLDDKGDALFLGDTSDNVTLPDGVLNNQGTITGKTGALTSKEGNQWAFYYNLENSAITVILPENAVLDSYSSGEISLERGQIAISDGSSANIKYHIEESSNWNGIWIIAIIAVLLGIYFYLKRFVKKETRLNRKKVKKDIDKFKIVEGILNDRERLIINELKKVKRAKMSYLRKKTGISKAAFSRHVQQLSKKNLLLIEGEGRNKILRLR